MSEQIKEKPGYKTTEWYISLLVVILGALTSAGVFGADHWVIKVIGLATGALAAAGYTSARAKTKLGASLERARLGKSPAE